MFLVNKESNIVHILSKDQRYGGGSHSICSLYWIPSCAKGSIGGVEFFTKQYGAISHRSRLCKACMEYLNSKEQKSSKRMFGVLQLGLFAEKVAITNIS